MKHLIIVLFAGILSACGGKSEKKEKETAPMAALEQTSQEGEWKVLFDGKSFKHWKGYLQDSVPAPWKLEEGAMVFYPPEDRPEGASYNIVSRDSFHSFVLELEWKIAEGGNSGLFWAVQEAEEYGQPYETGPEIQVLDNQGHPDAKNGPTRQAGALYDMVGPSEDATKPAGEWNQMQLTVDYEAQRGQVVLNGTQVVAFPLANELWNVMVSKSKFAGWSGFGKSLGGKIGLQDHGDQVAYRNIRIKEL